MRWLLHGNLTPAVAAALARHEQTAQTVADLALPDGAGVEEILEAARVKQLEILTNDGSFIDRLFNERSRFNRLIVFLQLSGGEVEQDDAINRLFERYKRLSAGRLYTVTGTRVKVRQLPGVR